jgi:hypothetical protein
MRIRSRTLGVMAILALILAVTTGTAAAVTSKNYGDVTLSGGSQTGHFDDVWSLVACDMTVSFTYDANGLVDDSGAHAWSQLGVRAIGYADFNPTWQSEGAGVWLSTDYDWTVDTFDPDPVGSPSLDLDDKLILQKGGGWGEGSYNLPTPPPNPAANHRVWWDRDGVDPWQNAETANTGGMYDVVITFHANTATSGTAYMTINGLAQGFETDGNWSTIELAPAGMTFTGDMKHLQIFYGLYGYGATHGVAFKNISISGCLQPSGVITSPGEDVLITDTANFDATYADDDPGGVQWAVRYNTCAAATNTVWGNVDGHSDPYSWNGSAFHSQVDTSTWTPGHYCFVFNPVEGTGEDDMRLTRWFWVRGTIDVGIDIKPGSEPNAINLSANGVIPVAILGSADFDVNDVDPTTVTLEGAALRLKGKSGNYGSFEDVNGDGYPDLVVHIVDFTVSDGATTATLTGSLWDGTPIEGTDSIVIVHE